MRDSVKPHPIRAKEKHHIHFVTTSCYHRLPFFEEPIIRTVFLQFLSEVRSRYHMRIVGYVIMPEHAHFLVCDSNREISDSVRIIKSITARELRKRALIDSPHVWQARFYSFNIYREEKLHEKLDYRHKNPVLRNLVESPWDWAHSSYRFYEYGDESVFRVDKWWEIWGVEV